MSNPMAKILGVFSFVFAVSAYAAPADLLSVPETRREVGADSIVAVVEDKVITRQDVMREIEPFLPQIRSSARSEYEFNAQINAYAREIVRNMIDRELIVKEFGDKGMKIPQSYLDKYFDDYIKREFGGDRADFTKFIQQQGKTIKTFKSEQEKEIIVGYMQDQKRRTISEISPQKIKDYYEANKDKWFTPQSAHVFLITLTPSAGATLEDNRKLASEIVSDIRKGADFSAKAKKYSRDDASAKGGDSGWFNREQLVSALDEKAFSMPIGEVSDPIEVADTVFIMKVAERKDAHQQDVEEVRNQIEWAIAAQNAKESYAKWLQRLREKAYIKFYQ